MPRYPDYVSEQATVNLDGTTTIRDIHYQWDGLHFVKALHTRSFSVEETNFRVEQIARNANESNLGGYVDPGGQYSLLPIDIAWLRMAIERGYITLDKAQSTFANFRALGPLEWAFHPSLPDRIPEAQELSFFGPDPFRSMIPAIDVLTKPNAYVDTKVTDSPNRAWSDREGISREEAIGEAWANHSIAQIASAAKALLEEASEPERAEPKVAYVLTASTHQDWIQKLYLAFFLRPADPGGFNYYAQKLAAGGTDIPSIASGFANSPEYLQTYSGMSTAQRIDAIYRNLFDRPAEPEGREYWGDRLESGIFNVSNIAFSVLIGAQNADLATINNRIEISKRFTSKLDTQRELEAYSGLDAASTARELLRTVSGETSTLADAVGTIDRTIKYFGVSGKISTTAAGDNIALGNDAKADVLIYSSADRGRLDTVVGFQANDRIELSTLSLANSVQTRRMSAPQSSDSPNFFAEQSVVIGRYGSDSYVYLDMNKDGNFSSSLDTVVRLIGVELQPNSLTI